MLVNKAIGLTVAAAVCIIVLIIIAAIGVLRINAQNSAPTITNTTGAITKSISNNSDFFEFHEGKAIPKVDILYESPTNLIVRSDSIHSQYLGNVIDLANKLGYHISSTTVFTDGNLIDYYTVFMSKK